MTKRTKAIVEAELQEERKRNVELRNDRDRLRDDVRFHKDAQEAGARDFGDLKQRLHAAEMENQRMRGYIARVQEDDTVREDLVTIGEPGGEQQMVPKRKATEFHRPSDFTNPQYDSDRGIYNTRDQRKPRHWLTY